MNPLITIDMETYFDTAYSLSKMSTEAYVRDPQFKVHGVGVKVGSNPAIWVPEEEVVLALEALDIPNSPVLAHHAQFDGFILAEHYNLRPKIWFDTLSMGRAIVGAEVGGSLKKLTEHYKLGAKGDELLSVKGVRDLTFHQSAVLGEYCKNDVELTYKLFMAMQGELPKAEMKLIDSIIRMFTEPMLRLDYTLLKDSLEEIQSNKLLLLLEAGVGKDELMSNNKFAELLTQFGVYPPTKISHRTGKQTFAFAKTDEPMKALLEHPDERVQALVAARMGVKSTIAETRTQAFMGMALRGAAPVYLKYSGAGQTHRLSGGDKVNWQNLGRGSKLRDAVMAPDGMTLVVIDSSNIESRVLDYLAGEQRALEAYRANDEGRGPDIYCFTAELIYGRPIDKEEDPDERFLGKVAKLGLGYGMGKDKFYATVKQWGVPGATEELAIMSVDVYRNSHKNVVKLWGRFDSIIPNLIDGRPAFVDPHSILAVRKGYVELPNGLRIKYPNLAHHPESGWTFSGGFGGKERIKLYGGKGIENCIAAGTLVLTDSGWKPIESVRDSDLVHDGVEFVAHGGMIFKAVQPCVIIDGVYMTPDHEVLTDEGWKAALEKPEPYRPDLRGVDGVAHVAQQRKENVVGVQMHMRQAGYQGGSGCYQGGETQRNAQLRVSDRTAYKAEERDSSYVKASGLRGLEKYVRQVQTAIAQGLEKLRRAWNYSMRKMDGFVRGILGGYGGVLRVWTFSGQDRQLIGVQSGELPMGHAQAASIEQAGVFGCRHSGAVKGNGNSKIDTLLSSEARPVFDIVNCGPRHRFVVMGAAGPFIVHNCVQALARLIVMEQSQKLAKKYQWVHSVHDEAVFCVPEAQADECLADALTVFRTSPTWAPDLPLNAAGNYGQRYGDAK